MYKLNYSTFGKKEKKALTDIIKSDFYSMGPKVKEYEDYLSKYFKSKYAVAVNSGSSANHIALTAMTFLKSGFLKPGDEIIVPAVSWSTTYSPIYFNNMKMKFVDVDLNTLNFDLNDLENKITTKTRAIFCVNLTGNPNDFSKIKRIIGKRKIYIFEDNCESMGARYNGKFTGTFGEFGTMSTYFSHHISTMEGGIVLTNNRELYEIMLSIRSHGWTRNLPKNSIIHKFSKNKFDENFNFILPGFNLRPLEMSGALGLVQMKKLKSFLTQRKKNFEFFSKLFKNNPNILIQKAIGEPSHFCFTIILKNKLQGKRDKLVRELSKYKIETRPICGGSILKSKMAKKYFKTKYESLPNTEYLDLNGFFVGNSHLNLSKEIKLFKKVIDNFD